MRSDKKIENKAIAPAETKEDPQEKTVRVQVKPNRAVAGIGGAGATKRINSELAKDLAGQGLVTIL